MTVGILGLGLIGGSMARAYAKEGHTVYGCEKDRSMLEFAQLAGAVHGVLDESTLPECDLVLLAVNPGAAAGWLEENAAAVAPNALVLDLCGTKKEVCRRCFPLAQKYGFTFVGGHPMAGTHFSGFKYSRSNLFQGAPMVLSPYRFDDMALLERVKAALAPCRFGSFSVITAREHDKRIAFTSQMPHILSNAYVKSPTAQDHKGFSAGSYKDLTRVARLNPRMWAELTMENRDNVIFELDSYVGSLVEYRMALADRDMELLVELLEEGCRKKEEIDG